MPDPLRLRDLREELSVIFREAWLHDEPGIGNREWLSFSDMDGQLCLRGRCRILAHAVKEP